MLGRLADSMVLAGIEEVMPVRLADSMVLALEERSIVYPAQMILATYIARVLLRQMLGVLLHDHCRSVHEAEFSRENEDNAKIRTLKPEIFCIILLRSSSSLTASE